MMNPIIQVENKKKSRCFLNKKSRLSLSPPKMACLEPWTQEFNFLKFPCESGSMDFSMKWKSLRLLAYDEIKSFKLKIK